MSSLERHRPESNTGAWNWFASVFRRAITPRPKTPYDELREVIKKLPDPHSATLGVQIFHDESADEPSVCYELYNLADYKALKSMLELILAEQENYSFTILDK